MRNDLYDIEKGILIVCVVIAHVLIPETFLHRVLSFRIPVFFMIAGMLSHWDVEPKLLLKKRAKAYVIPYFSWCILLFMLFWIENPFKYLVRILYGGAMNTTTFTFPFWFICALFVASIVFNYVWRIRKWAFVIITIWLICWYTFLGNHSIPPLPWSLEVVPFAIMYFFIGIFTRKMEESLVERQNNYFYIIPFIIAMLFVTGYFNGYIDYFITMKNPKFECLPLDILYPITFHLAIKGICVMIKTSNQLKDVFVYVGKASLVIMYTHPSAFYLYNAITPSVLSQSIIDTNLIIAIKALFAIAIGCCVYKGFSKNKQLSMLFLGKK